MPIFMDQPASGTYFDNSINSFTSTNVQSAIEEVFNKINSLTINKINNLEINATTLDTSLSITPVVMAGMTVTPGAGTYIVFFSAAITSVLSGSTITISLFINGVQKADSVRIISPYAGGSSSATSAIGAISINGLVTVAAGQAVDIRWSRSGGNATVAARTLNLIQVG